MTTRKEHGLPARPPAKTKPGPTLLDFFAAAALQSPMFVRALEETPLAHGETIGQHAAKIAYAVARRMMEERAK